MTHPRTAITGGTGFGPGAQGHYAELPAGATRLRVAVPRVEVGGRRADPRLASRLHDPQGRHDMWDTVEPYAAQLLRDERGNIVQALGQEALSFAGTVARLPQRLDALADRVE